VLPINSWRPCYFTKVPDVPQPYTLNILWLQEKGAQVHILSEAKDSHSQRMCATVLSFAPHLQNGLSDSSIRWRCLLRVLCPVRRPATALDCVLWKDRNLALALRQGPKINYRACLWALPRPHHYTQCRLTNRLNLCRVVSEGFAV
jgi:hypothetical protein